MRRPILWTGAALLAAVLLLVWRACRAPGIPDSAGTPPRETAPAVAASARPDAEEHTAAPVRHAAAVPPAPPAPITPCVLEVLVMAPDGSPVPGVGVEVQPDDGLDETFARRAQATGAKGLAVFANLEPGLYAIRLDRGPGAECGLTGPEPQRIVLRLKDGVDLEGIVVDTFDRPVPGAGIWLLAPSNGTPVRDVRAYRAATSDTDGRFRLHRVVHAQWVQARKDGHAPSPLRFLVARESSEELRLQLGGEAAVLAGSVIAGGTPVAGARLRIERPRPSMSRVKDVVEQEHIERAFRADAEGRFELRDLLPGPATVRARAPGNAPGEADVVLEAAVVRELLLELAPGASLTGAVRDPEGKPIAGAEVSAGAGSSQRWHSLWRTRTTRDGGFHLLDLPPGEVGVQVSKAGEFCGARHEQEVAPGERAECEIVLWPLTHLRGRVVDPSGQGLSGFAVVPRPARFQRGYFAVETDDKGRIGLRPGPAPTDEDGQFDARVMPEQAYILDVRGRDQWLDIDGEPLGAFVGPRDGIVVTVRDSDRATAHVQGRIVGRNGLPLEGAWFQIGDGRRLGTVGHNTPGTKRSAADGSFRIGPIPARRYRITVRAESAGIAKFETEGFELAPHQVLELGDVHVPGSTARLVVDLRFGDGTPVRGALLQLDDPATEGSDLVLNLDKEGHLDQEVLPGRFELTLYGGRFRRVREILELTAGEERRVEYVTEVAAPRAIRLTFPPGEKRGNLVIRDPDGGLLDWEIPVPEGGKLTLEPSFSLGRHEVEFTGASGARYAGAFDVASLEPHQEPVDVVLLRR